jgi:hypothetical protein
MKQQVNKTTVGWFKGAYTVEIKTKRATQESMRDVNVSSFLWRSMVDRMYLGKIWIAGYNITKQG